MEKGAMTRKLAAAKALAENGVGGEKEIARRLYEELRAKYGITDQAVDAAGKLTAAQVKKEFADIALAILLLTNHQREGKAVDKEYEELKQQFEKGSSLMKTVP